MIGRWQYRHIKLITQAQKVLEQWHFLYLEQDFWLNVMSIMTNEYNIHFIPILKIAAKVGSI